MDSCGCTRTPSFLKTSLSIPKLMQWLRVFAYIRHLQGLFKPGLLDLTFRSIDLVGLGDREAEFAFLAISQVMCTLHVWGPQLARHWGETYLSDKESFELFVKIQVLGFSWFGPGPEILHFLRFPRWSVLLVHGAWVAGPKNPSGMTRPEETYTSCG